MPKGPLALVKDRFGSKEALVAAVQKLATADLWIDRVDADKGLDSVPNRKLLRLHDVLASVKKDFGSRAKLIDAITAACKRAKDTDYAARLARYPTPRLVDMWRGLQRQERASTRKPS